jgi:hypothetical protein
MAAETFTDRMVDKTLGRAVQPKRGQNYNYPLRWYAKPDGDIVQLQSDPQARAWYADKGFHLLAESPARGELLSEVEEWERVERPKLIEQQVRKAKLINAIRRTESKDPTLGVLVDVEDLDDRSIEDLEEVVRDIRARGGNVRLTEAKRRPQPEEQRSEALLRGVERAETNSLEDLQRKLSAEGSQARTIQGTGHDPIDESRRRKQ